MSWTSQSAAVGLVCMDARTDHREIAPGLEVSTLALGTWQTFERMQFDECLAVLQTAFEAGVTLFDTARYHPRSDRFPPQTIAIGSPHVEVVLGRALQVLGWPRSAYRIADKLWYDRWPQESLERQQAGALMRLGLEYVDVLYLQRPPAGADVATVTREAARLVAAGRARCWGVAGWAPEQLDLAYRVTDAEGLPPCAVIELMYSVARRKPVEDRPYERLYAERGLRVVASSPLEGGVLAGRVPGPDTARVTGRDFDNNRQRFQERLPDYLAACKRLELTPTQAALAFCATHPAVASVLFGASSPEQTRQNLAAVETIRSLGDELRERLAPFG